MTARELTSKLATIRHEISLVRRNKAQFDKQLRAFDASDFPGRIETNEIKRARIESARLANELKDLNTDKKRYEELKKKI